MASNISIQRLNRWVEKQFNIKGGPTLLDVDAAIRVVLAVNSGVETRVLEGWNRYLLNATAPAVAAALSVVRIRNPVGSNIIAVLEMASAMGALADGPQLIFQNNGTDFGTVVTPGALDLRGNLFPTLVASLGSNATVLGTTGLDGRFSANTAYDWIKTTSQEMPINPGNTLSVWGGTLNQAVLVSLMWRERALETSELTG